MSLLAAQAPDLVGLSATASALADTPVRRLVPVRGGGNNRLFRVEGQNGAVYALKAYLRERSDSPERIGRECDGLGFLWRQGIRTVPRVLAADQATACALFNWIDGAPVARAGQHDIVAALGFIESLKECTRHAEARNLQPAAEACFSGVELARQVGRRLDRLREPAARTPALRALLEGQFEPLFERHLEAARRGFAAAGLVWHQPLDREHRTLSPSDFGFHNALRTVDRRLVFLDFEYFGWDDPVKLVADFLLHPGMRLQASQKTHFRRGAEDIFSDDAAFSVRLRLLYPLFGLRWAAIILNEFLPERWERRAFAGAHDQVAAATRQLMKARRLLARLASDTGGFPNDA